MRKIAAVALAGAVIGSGLVLSAPAAQADWQNCPAGYLCMWDDANYLDTVKNLKTRDNDLQNPAGITDFGDKTSSIRNNSGVAFIVHDDTNYGGRAYCIKSGIRIWNLQLEPWEFGDKISSAQARSDNTCGPYPHF